jgi:hypothetical protein
MSQVPKESLKYSQDVLSSTKERPRKQPGSSMVINEGAQSMAAPPHNTVKTKEGFFVAGSVLLSMMKQLVAADLTGLLHVSGSYVGTTSAFDHILSKGGPYTKLYQKLSAGTETAIVGSMRLLSHIGKIKTPLAIMLFAALISPATATDTEIALHQYPTASLGAPDPGAGVQMAFVGTYILVAAGLLVTTAQSLLAPLMGISSVLWFIMRNDAAIKPSVSWA